MLDASPAAAMTAPPCISHDPVVSKAWRDELAYAAIATIGEDAAVPRAQLFDDGSSVVKRIVTVARAAGGGRDDTKVSTSHQDLSITRPSVVLGLRRRA